MPTRCLSLALLFALMPAAPTLVTTYNVLCSFCGDGHFDDNPYDDWATRLLICSDNRSL